MRRMRRKRAIKLFEKAGYEKTSSWFGRSSSVNFIRGNFEIELYEDKIIVFDNYYNYIAATLDSQRVPYANIPYDTLIQIMVGLEKDIMNKLSNLETERILSSL